MYFAKILNGKQGYSKRQIHNAERVEAFVETIGNPSEKDSRTLVRTDGILKCPITIEDVDIYFKPIVTLYSDITIEHFFEPQSPTELT